MSEGMEIVDICLFLFEVTNQLYPLIFNLLFYFTVVLFEDVGQEETFEYIWNYIVSEGDIWFEDVGYESIVLFLATGDVEDEAIEYTVRFYEERL